MKVYKRNGQEVDFALDKIRNAIDKANRSTFNKYIKEINEISESATGKKFKYEELVNMSNDELNSKHLKSIGQYILIDGAFDKALEQTQKFLKPFDVVSVNDINDLVEKALMKVNAYNVAKEFITYRENKKNSSKFTDTEEKVLSVIDGTNEELRGDNANKHIDVNSSARDYIAGTVCKSIAEKILPSDVLKAHKKKLIHFHDMDYSPVMHEHNCDLLDLEDMLDNGFCMNDVGIKSPRRFSTAANLAAQVNLIASSSQYGGQTITWTALAKYVESTRKDIAVKLAINLLGAADVTSFDSFAHCRNIEEIYKHYIHLAPGILGKPSFKWFSSMVESETKHDVHVGVKTYQYQVLCHQSSQGQTPFVSNVLNLREAQNEQELKDLAFIIEEVLKRRIKGVTDKNGLRMAPLFPKLLYYVNDGLNLKPEDPYYYLTKLAAKCMTTSMQPDIISEKKNREAKKGQMQPCMGCRSFPFATWVEKTYPADTKFYWQNITEDNMYYSNAPGKNFDYSRGFGVYDALPKNATKESIVMNFRGNSGWVKQFNDDNTVTVLVPKPYAKWNAGVVTVNIPYAALQARKEVNDKLGIDIGEYDKSHLDEYKAAFYRHYDSLLDICHEALQFRWNAVKKIKAKNAPILWMYGALARLPEDATIGETLMSTDDIDAVSLSIGYIGLYETCRAVINDTNTSKNGQKFSVEVLQHMNEMTTKWRVEEHIGYSIYGTPEESLTMAASMALKRDFGQVAGVNDHDYVTNSYHVNPAEPIDAWTKLKIEGQYLQLSPGGAVSYVEVPDMKKNPRALEEVIQYMYDNIMYSEVNSKIDTCYKCGYLGEMKMLKTDNGKFKFRCPNCGNEEDSQMRVERRICGYMGVVSSGNTNHSRLADIYDRVLHLDAE